MRKIEPGSDIVLHARLSAPNAYEHRRVKSLRAVGISHHYKLEGLDAFYYSDEIVYVGPSLECATLADLLNTDATMEQEACAAIRDKHKEFRRNLIASMETSQ